MKQVFIRKQVITYNIMDLNKTQVQAILDDAKKNGMPTDLVMDGLIKKGYNIEGIDSEARRVELTPKVAQSGFNEAISDIKETGQGVVDVFKESGKQFQGIADRAREQSFGSTIKQGAGQGLATAANIFGELVIGGGKLALGQEKEDLALDTVNQIITGYTGINNGNVGEGINMLIEGYNHLKETDPEKAGNLRANMQILEAIVDASGIGLADDAFKGLKRITSEVADTAVTKVDNAFVRGGKLISDKVDSAKDLFRPAGITDTGLTKAEIQAGIRPDIKKSILGKEEGLQEYFDVTRKRLNDETAKTPTGLLTEKAESAFKQVEEILAETGSGIGAKRTKLGSVKASQEQAQSLMNTLDNELKSLGLTTTKTGGITKGKGIVDVSDAELKLLSELRSDLLKVKGDAKVETIQKAINKFRNRVDFGKSSQEVSGVMDGLLKKVSGEASTINKSILGNEAAGQYARYSEIADFLKETKNIRKNPQVVLRRILSSDSAKGLEFAETIKELTGVDLIKESRFAKIAVDTFGDVNPELGTRFRQQLTDSGVAAGNILSKAGGKAGAIGKVIELVQDIPKAVRNEFLLREGINPALVEAEDLAELILESARGGTKTVDEVVSAIKKTPVKKATVKTPSDKSFTLSKSDKEAIEQLKQTIKDTPNKQGGFVKVGKADDLIEQAKKFDNVDDFIESQDIVYHGTNADFDKFDISKIGSQTDDGLYGRGFYFTPNRNMALNAPLGKQAKIVRELILDTKNPLELNKFKSIDELAEYLDMSESAFVKQADGTIRPVNSQINQFTSHVKDLGHDAVYVRRGGVGDEVVVFDPEIIKTKKDLTDIFNQAKNTK